MKKKDIFVIVMLILLIGITSILSFMLLDVKEDPLLQIQVGDEVYGQYDLNEDQVITINDSNIVTIQDGQATMTYADCPDQTCVHSLAINEKGGMIVCVPNQIILTIISGDQEIDSLAS